MSTSLDFTEKRFREGRNGSFAQALNNGLYLGTVSLLRLVQGGNWRHSMILVWQLCTNLRHNNRVLSLTWSFGVLSQFRSTKERRP